MTKVKVLHFCFGKRSLGKENESYKDKNGTAGLNSLYIVEHSKKLNIMSIVFFCRNSTNLLCNSTHFTRGHLNVALMSLPVISKSYRRFTW
jgi:hypothetical protein